MNSSNIQATQGANELHPALRLREAYESKVWQVLGNRRFAFVTVNLPKSSVLRVMSKHSDYDNPYVLGLAFSNAIRSRVPVLDAYKTLFVKFLLRLTTRLLKSKAVHQKQRLRWVCVYENQGKSYAGTGVTHVHMLIEVPCDCSFDRFCAEFRWLFCQVVYPASYESKVLNFKNGRNDHPWYSLKQHISPEIASERFEFYIPPLQENH